ncbi:AT-rich interactive domain protein [Melia azedarach]|uniref:AT-rich interactive domain protein n=1 Tax=Melia azedarach TaxID=155640 RepID=A0ACC1XRX7_MELAZ|nr:AT-rich interactive domain protein [Melia azedarach]
MISDTADKKKEAPREDVPVSSSKNTEQEQPNDVQAQASCSVPLKEPKFVSSENDNRPAENKTVLDVDDLKSQSTPQQDLPPSLSLDASGFTGSAEPDIHPPVTVGAEAYEVPDIKEDQPPANFEAKAQEVPDTKEDHSPANFETKTHEVHETKEDQPPADVEAKAHEITDSKEGTGFEIGHTVSINPKSALEVKAPTSLQLELPSDSTADAPADSTFEIPAASKVEAPTSSRAGALADTRVETTADARVEPPANSKTELPSDSKVKPSSEAEPAIPKPNASSSDLEIKNANVTELKNEVKKTEFHTPPTNEKSSMEQLFLLDGDYEGSESGTEEEQSAFMKELENFFRERSMEFKPPKFYGEGLNCLKLWRAVTRLGGYDKVTTCKLWRQVGESFKPPKTCTTVSWTFRGFYEKALLDYERHKTSGGELNLPVASQSEPMNIDNQASGSGRARRDAAARAMQGWHSQRVLGNGDVTDPIIKDKNSLSLQKREKQLGLLKRKKPSYVENAVKAARAKTSKSQLDVDVVDIGPPADWVKINVQKTKDCFEVYALVPGLLREEVRVQSDPVGRLVISGEPEHPDNPWGVTPFKKVVTLPARIDPHQTSAVVTLHGQLFVRVPFEQSDS